LGADSRQRAGVFGIDQSRESLRHAQARCPVVQNEKGVILTGDYLSEPQLLAVGYALEHALQGRVEPDLNATILPIEAVTGQ